MGTLLVCSLKTGVDDVMFNAYKKKKDKRPNLLVFHLWMHVECGYIITYCSGEEEEEEQDI